ncbi:MAG: outer membrane protein assembly factor BamA, partial [Candidatus Eisenbacteria bacterium]|nr:outer membrane protein assembly factor BamA [Candidatus Eisenbacteria bacterium]
MKSWGVRRGGATTSVAVSKRAGPGFALGSALFAFLLFAGLARGQSEPVFDVPVAGIEVRGNETAEKDLIVSTLNVPIGEPLNEQRLRAGVRALWNLGLFSSITVLAEPEAEAQKLIVDVVENRRVAAVEFAGNDKIGTEDLKGKVTLQPGQMLSDQKLFEGCRAIEKAYQDEGYASARCTSQVTPIEGNQVHVAFKIEEGPRVKIARVEIEGNQAFDDDKLRGEIKLKPNGLFHRKRYTAERLREERARLEEFYRNHGYRDAVVTVDDPQFEDVGKKVVLRFAVEEGQFYRFGDLTWSGNQAVTTTALQGIARFQPGDAFSQQALEQTTGEAYGLYTDKGFLLEVSIVPETTVENGRVNVAYRIEEGRPSHVQEIRIRGNRHTKEKVIRRELTLYPGDLLRRSALLRSQRDVFALGFFDDVQIDYEPTGDSTDVDIVYQVKEKTSGQLSGGMGYSSESGLTGFLQIGHPNLFGNGQSISLYLERGGRRENYELSFQDPWFLGHPVSVGIDVFNTRRTRDLCTETRRGGGLSVSYTHLRA